MTSDTRRALMHKMGVAGSAVLAVNLAGCLGGDDDDDTDDELDRPVEDGLSEERRIDKEFVHLSHAENYYPVRVQSHRLVRDRISETFGIDYVVDENEAGVRSEREANSEYDIEQYGFWSEQGGDPNIAISHHFYSDGQRNYGGYSDEEYDEVIEGSWEAYDPDDRQELVYRAQELLQEYRWESQYQHLELLFPYNTNVVDPDSVVPDGREVGTWATWCNLEPAEENESGVVATNNNDPTQLLNPFEQEAHVSGRNITPVYLLYDSLVRFHPNYERELWIADDIIDVDETTIDVTISDEFTFHDGEPLTIDDVLYTFELILETEPAGYLDNVTRQLDSVEQTDDNTVRFNLNEPFAPFINVAFWQVRIVPQHIWEPLLEETNSEDSPWEPSFSDDQPAIGSGPFQYGSWTPGERFEMPPHEDHPIAPPSVTRLQLPFDSASAEIESLDRGDYGYMDYWFGDNQQMADLVEETDYLEMDVLPHNRREAIWFNVSEDDDEWGGKPISDVSFRHAFNVIVNDLQSVFINELNDGFGVESNSPISPLVEFWHNPDLPWDRGTDQEAIDVLADAGYVWDSDGNLYLPEDMV